MCIYLSLPINRYPPLALETGQVVVPGGVGQTGGRVIVCPSDSIGRGSIIEYVYMRYIII